MKKDEKEIDIKDIETIKYLCLMSIIANLQQEPIAKDFYDLKLKNILN